MWLESTGTPNPAQLPIELNDTNPASGRPAWFPPGPVDPAGRYPGSWYISEGKVGRDMAIIEQTAQGEEEGGPGPLPRRRRRRQGESEDSQV